MRPPKDDFLTFRASGDAAALARVFDRIAPELLLVAHHLVGSDIEAEDLVQATFLQAIRNAHMFDASRALKPWMIGILANEARMEQRRRARRVDPERLPTRLQPGPVRVAQDEEFASEFSRCLDRLPEHYRHVLTLRYVHGLTPTEIAHSLARSPETVKTWLRRGRDILRRTMPAGFTAGLAVLMTPGRGIAALRTRVLEAAHVEPGASVVAQSLATTTTRAIESARAARMATFLKVAAVASVALLALGMQLTRDSDDIGTEQSTARVTDATADTNQPHANPHSSASASRSELAPGRYAARLRWSSGEPAAGVSLRLRPQFGKSPPLRDRWVRTGPDGTAEFGPLRDGAWLATVDRGESRTFTVRRGGSDVLDIALKGELLEAQVIEYATGKGIADAIVWLSVGSRYDEGIDIARTDATGHFSLRDVDPRRAFCVRAATFGASRLNSCAPTAEPRIVPLGTKARSVHGTVVDTQGRPVPGATVRFGNGYLRPEDFESCRSTSPPPFVARTDSSGGFSIDGFSPFVKLKVWACAPGYALWAREMPPAAKQVGKMRLRIVLGRGATITGTVDPSRDAEVELFHESFLAETRLRLLPHSADLSAPWGTLHCTTDRDGEFRFEDLPPGKVHLFARAGDDADTRTLELQSGDTKSWDPVLRPAGAIAGRVIRSDDGRPVAGIQVEAELGIGLPAPEPATTDENGDFEFRRCLPGDYDVSAYASEVGGVMRIRAVLTEDIPAGRRDLQLVFPARAIPSAWITGRAVANPPQAPYTKAMAYSRWFSRDATVGPDDGAFRIGPLPPGDFGVLVAGTEGARRLIRVTALQPGETRDLGVLHSEPTGRLYTTARDSTGLPLRNGWGFVFSADGLVNQWMVWYRDGQAASYEIPAGDFCLLVNHNGSRWLHPFTVRPGKTTKLHVRLEPEHPCEIQLHLPPGRLLSSGRIEVRDESGTLRTFTMLELKKPVPGPYPSTLRLPAGNYEVCALTYDGLRGKSRLQVSGRGSAIATLRLANE